MLEYLVFLGLGKKEKDHLNLGGWFLLGEFKGMETTRPTFV
jgi:hypothetical protein